MDRYVKGIWIPLELWEDTDLTLRELRLLMEIDSFTTQDRDCCITNDYIASFLNVNKSSASEILNSLIQKGYVAVASFDGRTRTVKSLLNLDKVNMQNSRTLPSEKAEPCLRKKPNKPINTTNTINNTPNNSISSITNTINNINNNIYKEDISNDISQKNWSVRLDFNKIKNLWNEKCTSFSRITMLSESRKSKIKLRIQEMGGWDSAIQTLNEIFDKMEASSFLKGENGKWKATFDWLFENDKNWLKVIEGNYDGQQNSTQRDSGRRGVDDIPTSLEGYSTTF